ncbi:MAG: hypothetical protein M3P51_04270 [Chloroflexota bacterium]|nr:hypothetical protein [Chloroflexota bacterium]
MEEQTTQAQDSISIEVTRGMAGKFSWSVKVKRFAPEGEQATMALSAEICTLIERTNEVLKAQYGKEGE